MQMKCGQNLITVSVFCMICIVVWKKGGYCLATFSGDDQSYKAKIRRIFKNDAGRMMALVSYEGYDSDCDEEQCCSALRPIVTKKKRRNAKQSKLPRGQSHFFCTVYSVLYVIDFKRKQILSKLCSLSRNEIIYLSCFFYSCIEICFFVYFGIQVECLSLRLCIYSDPNCLKEWSVRCAVLSMVLCTIKNPWIHLIRVGHIADFGFPSATIFPWLFRNRRRTTLTHYDNNNTTLAPQLAAQYFKVTFVLQLFCMS